MFAKNSGMIILGGGLIKHHVCNANLMVILEPVKTTPHANLRWNAKRDKRETQRERQIHRQKETQRQRWPLILACIMSTSSLAQLLQYIFAEITGMLNTVYVTRTLSWWSSSFSIKVTYFSCLSPVAM